MHDLLEKQMRFGRIEPALGPVKIDTGDCTLADIGLVKFTDRHLERLKAGVDEILSDGSVRSVHRFRVSTRRLNEPLQLINIVDSGAAKGVKKARKSLKRLRNLFGRVRDLDVLVAGLSDAQLTPSLPGDDHARLIDTLSAERRVAFVDALEGLSHTSPVQVAAKIRSVIEGVCNSGGSKRRSALIEAARGMWIDRADRVLKDASCESDSAGFHQLRVRLKGLRYCTELLFRMEDRDEDAVLAAFVNMQDALGSWNDHLFAARFLTQLATQDTVFANDPDWSAAILEYAGQRVRRSRDDREAARRRWPSLRQMIEAARNGTSASNPMSVDAAALAGALGRQVGAKLNLE